MYSALFSEVIVVKEADKQRRPSTPMKQVMSSTEVLDAQRSEQGTFVTPVDGTTAPQPKERTKVRWYAKTGIKNGPVD